MAIKHSPGCGCCGGSPPVCNKSINAGTYKATPDIWLYDDAIPSADTWAAEIIDVERFYLGCDSNGENGYLLEITNEASGEFVPAEYKFAIYDRSTDTLVTSATFLMPPDEGQGVRGAIKLYRKPNQLTNTVSIYMMPTYSGVSGDLYLQHYIYFTDLTLVGAEDRWGCEYVGGFPEVSFDYGTYGDSAIVQDTSVNRGCVICGYHSRSYSSTPYTFRGLNLVFTVSGLPDTYDDGAFNEYQNCAANNGTYTVVQDSDVPCLLENHILTFSYDNRAFESEGAWTTLYVSIDISKAIQSTNTGFGNFGSPTSSAPTPLTKYVVVQDPQPPPGPTWSQVSGYKWEKAAGSTTAEPLTRAYLSWEWVEPT